MKQNSKLDNRHNAGQLVFSDAIYDKEMTLLGFACLCCDKCRVFNADFFFAPQLNPAS